MIRFRYWLAPALLLLVVISASAQSRTPKPVPRAPDLSALYATSWALVIGINAYQNVSPRLNYAVPDARAVAAALPALGFPRQNIRLLLEGEATKTRIEDVLYRDFAAMGPQDRLLVFFAGHGETALTKTGEEGYLLPVNADLNALPITAIAMDELRRTANRLRAKHILFLLDTCFSGFALTRDVLPPTTTDEYLASVLREPVVQVLTFGRKGELAIEEGGHGLFTQRLLAGLRGLADTEGRGFITAAQLAAWIEPRVVRDSKGRMTPQYGKLDGEGQFVFLKPRSTTASVQPPPEPAPPTIREEIQKEFGSLVLRAEIDGVEVFLGDQRIGETKPGRALVVDELAVGTYRVKARRAGYREWEREVWVVANQRANISIDIEPLREAVNIVKGDDGADMVLIPGGAFLMGGSPQEIQDIIAYCSPGNKDSYCTTIDYEHHELPRHRVQLSAFYIDLYEVTNQLFGSFTKATGYRTAADRLGYSYIWQSKDGVMVRRQIPNATWRSPNGPGSAAESDHPVVHVSWHDASAYCKWAGKRLPFEAEWERAARGDHGSRYPWGDDWSPSRANVGNIVGTTTPVGRYEKGRSPYGAYDMAGNVGEWVEDWYDANYYAKSPSTNPPGPRWGTQRVIRGGWWTNAPAIATAGRRWRNPPDYTVNLHGFRCAKSATP